MHQIHGTEGIFRYAIDDQGGLEDSGQFGILRSSKSGVD